MHTTYLKSYKTLARVLFFLSVISLGAEYPSLYASSGGTTARSSWRHLLYYAPRTLRADTSLVDTPEFFLAPDGQNNSDSELEAFIIAIQKDSMKLPEPDRIACRYPARTLWLKKNRPEIRLPEIHCPQFDEWLAISKPKAVSIIFSSYYPNNPSSMMGHTFLRLRRGERKSVPLLDKAVNFAAEPAEVIPLLYAFQGLVGTFPGKFSMLPYYSKVQEYANAESRDLWEYDLNFSESETLAMMASLWELAPTRIDYFFFDENCSAVLIFLLQSARPELKLSEKLGFWVHPSDTLRILMEEPKLVSEVVYRPSSRSRYEAQREVLTGEEREILSTMIQTQTLEQSAYTKLPTVRKAAVLDTALAFIEFDERLSGSAAPVENVALYRLLLAARANIDAEPLQAFPAPALEAPHLGHKGQRIGLGLGQYGDRNEALFEYRPGPHDLLSPAIGYPPELSIELGKTRIAVEEGGKALLRSAELFHILSFNPARSGRFPWSWQMQLDYENTDSKTVNFRGSIGQALTLDERDHFLFGLFDARLMVEQGKLWACSGGTVGGRWSFGKRLVTLTQLGAERCYSDDVKPWVGLVTHAWRWSLDDAWELYGEFQKRNDSREITAGFYHYY